MNCRVRIVLLYVIFFLCFSSGYSQDAKKAKKNFETYFTDFKQEISSDRNTYSFSEYTDLVPVFSYPQEIELMADYDPDTFYNLYSYCIHNLRDTLIKVEDLKINDAAKKNYKEFKRSFLKGEASGNFNKKADEILAKKLKESLTDIKKPLIGYSQKVYISWVGPKGEKITERNLVFYTVKLEVVNFANCETATKGN